MLAAAARSRPPTVLADWLDSAALDAEAIGPNPHAERLAAAILRLPDPWPDAKRPHRPAT